MISLLKAVGFTILLVIVIALIIATLYASLLIVVASAVIFVGYMFYKFLSAT